MLITPQEAESRITAALPVLPTVDCPLENAHGRVLRQAITADRDLPPFDRVTMDGFALRHADLTAALDTTAFTISATQAAGMIARELPADNATVEIMTGATLAKGADTVVPYELTTRDGDLVRFTAEARALPKGNAIHPRGSDATSGAPLVSPGRRLSGREIALAATCGCTTLRVSEQPRISVVVTGDELLEVDAPFVAPHQIRRSNDYALRADLLTRGYTQVKRHHLRDVEHEIAERLQELLVASDVLILSGGVSKGKFDFLPKILVQLGVREIFHGVAQRPGKPLWFGLTARQTPVFALPGNPVSAYTCFHRYVLPALARLTGLAPAAPRHVRLAAPVTFAPPLAYLVPATITNNETGQTLATIKPFNTSGDLGGLIGTDGFLELPAHQTNFPPAHPVLFHPWN